MIALWNLFKLYVVGTRIGRVVAMVIVGFFGWIINNAWQRSIGAHQVITSSIEKGKAINATNEKVRERARQPGAAERLLSNNCRDC